MKTRSLRSGPRSPFPTRHRSAAGPATLDRPAGHLLGSLAADPTRGPGLSGPSDPSDRTGTRPSGPAGRLAFSPRDSQRIDELLRRPPGPCILCGRPPAARSIFVPTATASRALGAPRDRLRLVAYSLCRKCMALPDAQERAQELLLAEAERGLATPEAN